MPGRYHSFVPWLLFSDMHETSICPSIKISTLYSKILITFLKTEILQFVVLCAHCIFPLALKAKVGIINIMLIWRIPNLILIDFSWPLLTTYLVRTIWLVISIVTRRDILISLLPYLLHIKPVIFFTFAYILLISVERVRRIVSL